MRWLAVGVALGMVLAGCGDRPAPARELCDDLVHLAPTIDELGMFAAGTLVADLRAGLEKVETILDDVDAMTDRIPQQIRDQFWVALASYGARLEGVSDDRTVGGPAGPQIGTAGRALTVAAGAVRSALGCGV